MTKTINSDLRSIAVKDLNFDPENPRFAGMIASKGHLDENDTIHQMLKKQNIAELLVSIADQGFFAGEPLLVASEKNGRYTVVEGNRRLTALKILNGEHQNVIPPSIQEIVASAAQKPTEVPCLVFEERKDLIHYLGYRHITGVKPWGALEKAVYLKQLNDDLQQTYHNETASDIFKRLAREVGSKSPTVKQSLTSLALFNRAKEKDFYNLYGLSDDGIQFSFIYTALGYQNITNYLGIEAAQNTELTGIQDDKAKQLFSWMFAQDQQGRTILGESRNIQKLAAVVAHQDAVRMLVANGDLEEAYALSSGPEIAFNKIASMIQKSFKQIQDLLDNHGYMPTDEQEKSIDTISRQADGLLYDMRNIKKRQSRRDEE